MLKRNIKDYRKDKSGSTLVEFSLLFPLLMFLTLGTVEGGYIFYQVNGAQKATQLGARYAATRPPVAIYTGDCLSTGGIPNGTNAGVDCKDIAGYAPTSITCTSTSGSGSCDGALFTDVLDEMTNVFPFIDATNLSIKYEGTGLGYVGRGKAVPAITVELQNIQYNYIMVGRLVSWGGGNIGTTFNIDNVQTTVIGEDIGEGA